MVFQGRGERAVETPVTLGGRLGDVVEIVRGVKAGDRVVQSPDDSLKDGARINIAEK